MTTGCASSTKLVIPANLKTPCPNLLKLESGKGKDVMPVMIDDRRKYVDCSQRHAAVIGIIEKSSKWGLFAYNESGIFLNVYSSVYINIYKIKY